MKNSRRLPRHNRFVMSPAAKGYRLRGWFVRVDGCWANSGSGPRWHRAVRLALARPAPALRSGTAASPCREGARGRRRPTRAPGTAGRRRFAHARPITPDRGVMGRDGRRASIRGDPSEGLRKAGGIQAEPRRCRRVAPFGGGPALDLSLFIKRKSSPNPGGAVRE